MAFDTEIEYQGDTYELHINDIFECIEGVYPENIDLEITINKVVGEEKYYTDSSVLVYTERTRTYTITTDLEKLDDNFYKIIV